MKRLIFAVWLLFAATAMAADSALQVDFLLSGFVNPLTKKPPTNGYVLTYLDGTSTLSALWTDSGKGGTAANPIVLDTGGKAEVYGDNVYKFEIYEGDPFAGGTLLDTINGLNYKVDQSINIEYLSRYDSFSDAITAIGSSETTLVIDEPFTLTESISVPDNIAIEWKNGCLASGAYTLTINGALTAGAYKLFNDVTVLGLKDSYPEWWAKNTTPGTTDMSTSIQKAINAAAGGNIHFQNYVYGISVCLSVTDAMDGTNIIGYNSHTSGTKLKALAAMDQLLSLRGTGNTLDDDVLSTVSIKNIIFDGNSYADTDVRIDVARDINISNCTFVGAKNFSLYIGDDLNSTDNPSGRDVASAITVYNCRFVETVSGSQATIYGNTSSYILIDSCKLGGGNVCNRDILLRDCGLCRVFNSFSGLYSTGILIDSSSEANTTSRNPVDNIIQNHHWEDLDVGATHVRINMDGTGRGIVKNTIITGCSMGGNTSSFPVTIDASDTGRVINTVITNNKINSAASYPIKIETDLCFDTIVENNYWDVGYENVLDDGRYTKRDNTIKTFRATYDVTVDGGEIGTNKKLHFILPDNSTIIRAYYEVLETFTDAASDNAQIRIGVATDDTDGIVAFTAINDASNPWDAGYHDTLCDGTAANFTTKTTAGTRSILMYIIGAPLTAGKLVLYGEYITSE